MITYESTSVLVYSLNKDATLFTVPIASTLTTKGKALSAAWLNDLEILIGFQQGHIDIYSVKEGTQATKPIRSIGLVT